MFPSPSVCLFVCRFVCTISRKQIILSSPNSVQSLILILILIQLRSLLNRKVLGISVHLLDDSFSIEGTVYIVKIILISFLVYLSVCVSVSIIGEKMQIITKFDTYIVLAYFKMHVKDLCILNFAQSPQPFFYSFL